MIWCTFLHGVQSQLSTARIAIGNQLVQPKLFGMVILIGRISPKQCRENALLGILF